jgi:hypothetical protein
LNTERASLCVIELKYYFTVDIVRTDGLQAIRIYSFLIIEILNLISGANLVIIYFLPRKRRRSIHYNSRYKEERRRFFAADLIVIIDREIIRILYRSFSILIIFSRIPKDTEGA